MWTVTLRLHLLYLLAIFCGTVMTGQKAILLFIANLKFYFVFVLFWKGFLTWKVSECILYNHLCIQYQISVDYSVIYCSLKMLDL